MQTLEQALNAYMRNIERQWAQREKPLTWNETLAATGQPSVMTVLDDDYEVVAEVAEAEDVPKS